LRYEEGVIVRFDAVVSVRVSTVKTSTRCEISFTGKGLRNTALTMVKIAAFAPIPMASDSIETSANAGFFSNERSPNCRSFRRVSSVSSIVYAFSFKQSTLLYAENVHAQTNFSSAIARGEIAFRHMNL
jgi:hypothetical protein